MSEIQEEIDHRIHEVIRQGETELNLVGLGLASVPESVAELTNLTILNLTNNRLVELPDWMANFTPYLEYLLKAFKHAAPLVGPVMGIAVEKLDSQLKADCDLMKELAAQAPANLDYDDQLDIKSGERPLRRANNDADFRALEAMLLELDPNRIWGGLSRYTTPEGLTLYLCPQHLAAYRQPVADR